MALTKGADVWNKNVVALEMSLHLPVLSLWQGSLSLQTDLTPQCPLEVPTLHKQIFFGEQSTSSLQPFQPLCVFVFSAEQIPVLMKGFLSSCVCTATEIWDFRKVFGGSCSWEGLSPVHGAALFALLQPNKVSSSRPIHNTLIISPRI